MTARLLWGWNPQPDAVQTVSPVVPAIVGKKILAIVPIFFCAYVGNRTLGHALCVQRSRVDRPTPIPLTGVDLPNAAPPLGGAFLWLLRSSAWGTLVFQARSISSLDICSDGVRWARSFYKT
jgi:hypothetical protein